MITFFPAKMPYDEVSQSLIFMHLHTFESHNYKHYVSFIFHTNRDSCNIRFTVSYKSSWPWLLTCIRGSVKISVICGITF